MIWKNMPSLAALRAFEAAARHQNFSKAARELNVTHAAIVHHVRNLEAEFATSLLVRQGRGVALTAKGQKLAAELQMGFAKLSDAIDTLLQDEQQRPLNISLTPMFAANWLMPRIGEFWKNHPEISINMNPSERLVDLQKEEFDLAIRYGKGEWEGVNCELLTDNDFFVVAHPDFVLAHAISSLEDTKDLPWFSEGSMIERNKVLELHGIDLETLNVTHFNSNDLVHSAVSAQLGVTAQPKSLVQKQINDGRLTLIHRLNMPNYGYYMLTLKNRENQAIKKFKSWLRTVAIEQN